jgi:hypothetical protein
MKDIQNNDQKDKETTTGPQNTTQGLGSWCLTYFQQYFSYIVAVSLLMDKTGIPRENLRPAASH